MFTLAISETARSVRLLFTPQPHRDAVNAGMATAPVIFLDIDGVLLPFGEGVPACAADADPARSFPRQCLAALARLLEERSPPQPAP